MHPTFFLIICSLHIEKWWHFDFFNLADLNLTSRCNHRPPIIGGPHHDSTPAPPILARLRFLITPPAAFLTESWNAGRRKKNQRRLFRYLWIRAEWRASGTSSDSGVDNGDGSGEVLHIGHVACILIQASMHATWKAWPQSGSMRSRSESL